MIVPALDRGTVVLTCTKVSCKAELEADVSEGTFHKGESDGPYTGEDYYVFICPFCKSHLTAVMSQVQWSRTPTTDKPL